jgi:hypothetical protein
MIAGVVLILAAVLAHVCLRARSGRAPFRRDELLRMRQHYERVHREEVLPFE